TLRGDGDDVPAWPVFGCEEAAGEVIFMPTGEDEDDGRPGRETRGRGVSPPVPHLLPERRGVGLPAVLHGVADEEQGHGTAGQCAVAASGRDAAVGVGWLPLVLRGRVRGYREVQVAGVLGDVVADGAAPPSGDVRFVRGDSDAQVRVLSERPQGEATGCALAL